MSETPKGQESESEIQPTEAAQAQNPEISNISEGVEKAVPLNIMGRMLDPNKVITEYEDETKQPWDEGYRTEKTGVFDPTELVRIEDEELYGELEKLLEIPEGTRKSLDEDYLWSFFEGDFTANGQNYEYEINTVPGEIYIRVKDPIHKRTYENIVTLLENGKIEIAGWGDADNIDRELTEKELNKLSSFTFDFLTDFLSKNRDKKMDAMRGSGIFQK